MRIAPKTKIDILFMWLTFSQILGCEKSTLGPTISKPSQSDASNASEDNGASYSSGSLSCAANPTRILFYGGSDIKQLFSCNVNVSSLDSKTVPSFLTGSFANTSVAFTGSAPTTAGLYSWDYSVNSASGNSFSVKTSILDPSLLTSTISPPISIDTTNNSTSINDSEIDLGHTATLDSSWDGDISDVSLKTASINTDIPGISLVDSCASASGSYVCNGSASSSTLTVNNGLKAKWRWSAFDQGPYFLDIYPQITIENGVTTLQTASIAASIPIQSNGNVQITAANNPDSNNDYDSLMHRYGIAISNQSSALNPIVGLLYTDKGTGARSFFQRISVNRTAPPGGTTNVLTENGGYIQQINSDSQDFSIANLNDGSWLAVGGVGTTGSVDVLINKISDSSVSPSLNGSGITITNFSNTTDLADAISISQPFEDNGTKRIGLVFVRTDTSNNNRYLTVAKINPTGTNSSTVLDDLNYGVSTSGGYSRFQMPATLSGIDRTRIKWISEGGIGYLYVAFREGTNLKILKLGSQYASGYNSMSAVVTSNAFANSDTTNTNLQTLELALGTSSGSTVAAIVYRNSLGDCYFRRVDSSLQASAALKFGTAPCYNPTIHWAPSGRFVATYAERQASPSTKYDIKTTEFNLGATDSNSTPVVVVANLTSYPVKLVTDLYANGNWMAVFYRLFSSPTLRFHGYHVPGR